VTTRWERLQQQRFPRVRGTLGAAKTVLGEALRPTVHARHVEWSIVSSAIDLEPRPTDELINVALSAAAAAHTLTLDDVARRAPDLATRQLLQLWPGEHYRYLAGVCSVRNPELCVEVGTFQGAASLVLKSFCPRVVTYDVLPWSDFDTTWLDASDFDGRLEQRIADLSDPTAFASNADILASADVIFIDGPKDGQFEESFLRLLRTLPDKNQLLVFDDIRLMKMAGFWRRLPLPKLDVTSLAHSTGTGLALR
jgi:predicted O-methyltransferase YrrM